MEVEMMDGITDSMDMSLSKLQSKLKFTGRPGVLQPMESQESDATKQLN